MKRSVLRPLATARQRLIALLGYVGIVVGSQYVHSPSLDGLVVVAVVASTIFVGFVIGRWWVILWASVWWLTLLLPHLSTPSSENDLNSVALLAVFVVPVAALLLACGAMFRWGFSHWQKKKSPSRA